MSNIIRGHINELSNINTELTRLRTLIKNLKIRKAEVESGILNFLDEKNEVGVKMNDIAVIAQNKQRRTYKKQSERRKDGAYILRGHNIHNADEVLDEIVEAMRGEKEDKKTIVIQKLRGN